MICNILATVSNKKHLTQVAFDSVTKYKPSMLTTELNSTLLQDYKLILPETTIKNQRFVGLGQ
jgi:hypothetical protein